MFTLTTIPKETIDETTTQINSRIARAFLLREFLGDCDFTAYNGGIVFNPVTKRMRYAPNHDYGESFNALIRDKLDFDPYYGMTKEQYESLPEKVKQIIALKCKKNANESIDDIAKKFASGTSEKNFYYVIKNFPKACSEFFQNIDHSIQMNEFDKIIDSYSEITYNGTPLLNEEERNAFKEYLSLRAVHLSEYYVSYLKENGMQVPASTMTIDDIQM